MEKTPQSEEEAVVKERGEWRMWAMCGSASLTVKGSGVCAAIKSLFFLEAFDVSEQWESLWKEPGQSMKNYEERSPRKMLEHIWVDFEVLFLSSLTSNTITECLHWFTSKCFQMYENFHPICLYYPGLFTLSHLLFLWFHFTLRHKWIHQNQFVGKYFWLLLSNLFPPFSLALRALPLSLYSGLIRLQGIKAESGHRDKYTAEIWVRASKYWLAHCHRERERETFKGE